MWNDNLGIKLIILTVIIFVIFLVVVKIFYKEDVEIIKYDSKTGTVWVRINKIDASKPFTFYINYNELEEWSKIEVGK